MLEGLKAVLTLPDVEAEEARQILGRVLTEVEERARETVAAVRKRCRPLEEMGEGVEQMNAGLAASYTRMFEGLAIKGVYHAPTFGYTLENAPHEEVPPLRFLSMQVEAWFIVLRKITVVDMVLTNRLFQARQQTNMTQLDWFNRDDLKAIYKQTEKMGVVQTLGNLLNSAIVYTHCPKLEVHRKLTGRGLEEKEQNTFLTEGIQLSMKSVIEPVDLKNWIVSMLEGVAEVDINKIGSADPRLFENYRYSHKISFLCSKLIRDLTALLTETHLVHILHECRAVELLTNPKQHTLFEGELSQMFNKVVVLAAQVVSKIGDLFTLEESVKQQKERAKEMEELEGPAENREVDATSTHLGKYTMLSMCLCPMLSMLLKITAIRGGSGAHNPEIEGPGTQQGPTFLDLFVKRVMVGAFKWPTVELYNQIWMIADERNFGMDFWAQIYALVDERVSWNIFDTNQHESLEKVDSDLILLHMLYLGRSNLIHLTNTEAVDLGANVAKTYIAQVEYQDLTFRL